MLDVLTDLGAASTYSFWLPVLMWTAVALPAWALLSRSSLHPLAQYRLRQVLLAALPVGLVATALVDASGWLAALGGALWPAPSGSVSGGSVVAVPDVAVATSSPAAPSTWTWAQAIGAATVIAAGGALVGLGRMARDLVAFLRLRRSVETEWAPDLQPKVNALRRRLGIRRAIRVEVTERDVVPMTLAGWPVTLLLPQRLTDRPEALRMTLLHECIHVRRRDDLAHVAERLLAAVFAAIPVVGWLQQSIMQVREQACDAAVLDDHATRASSYAELLVAFADRAASSRTAMLSLSESPSSLKQRLQAMKRHVAFPSVRWISGFALAALVAVTLGIVACSDGLAPPTSSTESTSDAQPKTADDEVFTVVEQQPDCGGIQALQKHIQYPKMAAEAGIEGRVFVQFVVDETGAITEPEVTKGVHEMLDAAALNAVEKLECEPGRAQGEAVKVRMALPVSFRLNNSEKSDNSAEAGAGPTPGELTPSQTVDTPPRIQGGMQALQDAGTYPELAKKAGIQGRVLVQFTVGEDGSVSDAQVTSGAHDMLNQAALEAVRQLSFEPGQRDGQPIPVQMKLPITFNTDRGANVGQLPPQKSSDARPSSGDDAPESAQLNIQFQPDGTPLVNGTPTPIDEVQQAVERWRTRMVQMNDAMDLSVRIDGDAPLGVRKRVHEQMSDAFPGPNPPYPPANS